MTRPILYLHNRPIPADEANTVAVMHMCDAFARAGARVHLATFGGAADLDPFRAYGIEPNFQLTRWPPSQGPLAYPSLLARSLRKTTRDAVVYTRIPQLAAYSCLLGRPTVLEMHYPIAATRRGELSLKVLTLKQRSLIGLVATNDALAERLRTELPSARCPVIVAPTGSIDLGGDDGQPKPYDVGFVGSFYAGRGIELIMRLAERANDLKFLLVGGPETEREAQKGKTPPNVALRPSVPHRDIGSVLGAFDIGLAPYEDVIEIANSSINTAQWMSPMKLVEYMSAGKAIVASRMPAIEQLVRDGEEALLAPSGDVDAWASALDRLRDGAERRRLGAAARARYLAALSWDRRADYIVSQLGL